jgi:hypothetical protein
MSKYAPLTQHLTSRNQPQVAMRFDELERLLGFPLPPSARKHRAWWSNNPRNSVMTKAWLAAGYQSRDVDLTAERLLFEQLNAVEPTWQSRHPLIGCLMGTVTLAPGYDPTEPTDPDWEDRLLEKFDRLVGQSG